jgi:hypothetical protein
MRAGEGAEAEMDDADRALIAVIGRPGGHQRQMGRRKARRHRHCMQTLFRPISGQPMGPPASRQGR